MDIASFACYIVPDSETQEELVENVSFYSLLSANICSILIGPIPEVASGSMIVDDTSSFWFGNSSVSKAT